MGKTFIQYVLPVQYCRHNFGNFHNETLIDVIISEF